MEQKSLDNLEFGKILSIVASFAGSRAAKERLMQLRPSHDARQINAWLSEIEDYLEYSQSGLKLSPGGLRDIREIIEILHSGATVLGSDDLLKVKANIEVAGSLKKAFEDRSGAMIVRDGNALAQRIKMMPSLGALFQRIDDCLDDRGQIRNNASPTLTSIRREYAQAVTDIEKQLNAFLAGHADDVQDRYFTLRNERYVVPVQASSQSRIQGIMHDQSATGQTLFIEPLSFLPLNNRLAQLRLSEREEIKRIFTSLTALVYQSLPAVTEQFETLAWLDMVRARADFAVDYDASRPEVSDSGDLILNSARHPLIHPECVPLDIKLNPQQRCIIITGPNGGGKTVALKTVGINALLMQTGNFVLAAKDAQIPVFANILSDIGESQSIEDHLSTFTAHLKRLKEMADIADSHSLILIDEICVGTDPVEGGALASGFLKEMTGRSCFCVVTSHYDSLKHVAFTTPGFINAAMEFDYETFKPTFRFQIGIPGKSNALAMARVFQLPESILKDLVAANEGQAPDEKGLIEAIERERNRAEALRRTYVQKVASLRSREQEVDEALTQLREFRKTRRDKLTEEFTAELRGKLRDIEKTINRLRSVAADSGSGELDQAVADARNLHSQARSAMESLENACEEDDFKIPVSKDMAEADLSKLEVGMTVIWKANMRKGSIIHIDANRGRVELDLEGIQLKVPLSEVCSVHQSRSKKEEKASGSVHVIRPLIRSDLDLRGLRVEEAIEQVDTYLKVASESDLGRVFLIHGKGTGALQKAVEAYLKSSPWKKKFRPGRYGEGDLGVTVVVFNAEADSDEDPTQNLPGRQPATRKPRRQKTKK